MVQFPLIDIFHLLFDLGNDFYYVHYFYIFDITYLKVYIL